MLDYDTLLEKFKRLLKDNGLKFTKQRELILKTPPLRVQKALLSILMELHCYRYVEYSKEELAA